MAVIDTLITDRTQADVDRLKELSLKGAANWTDDERGEWLYGKPGPLTDVAGEQLYDANGELLECRDGVQRGAYNAADLNRVGAAVNELTAMLRRQGYLTHTAGKTDWRIGDVPTPAQLSEYLLQITKLRRALLLPAGTPEVPENLNPISYGKANDIETILLAVESARKKLLLGPPLCGDAVCEVENF